MRVQKKQARALIKKILNNEMVGWEVILEKTPLRQIIESVCGREVLEVTDEEVLEYIKKYPGFKPVSLNVIKGNKINAVLPGVYADNG